ncbi:MAG: hypothetical protein IT495_20445 [Gammaproteobacteria bacterium]|nr:hypothetical protein [Gammaproteobacteria bacterium]
MVDPRNACRALCAALLLGIGTAASGDDIVAPPWLRFDPFSTVQEWEFVAPGDTSADGGLLFNPNGPPFATIFPGVVFVPEGTGPSGLGGYTGTGDLEFSYLLFEIPNIPDNRPVKHIQIQINGVWTPGLEPVLTSVTGFFGPTFPPGVFAGSEETFPGFHRVEWWDIFPNPDFETLLLFLPNTTFVNQVVIDTISTIPLPAAWALLLAGLGGIGLAPRRTAARGRP